MSLLFLGLCDVKVRVPVHRSSTSSRVGSHGFDSRSSTLSWVEGWKKHSCLECSITSGWYKKNTPNLQHSIFDIALEQCILANVSYKA